MPKQDDNEFCERGIGSIQTRAKTKSEEIVVFLSSVSIPTVVAFVAIYIARVFEAVKIGFPISWAQITFTDFFLMLPFVSGVAFLFVSFVPFMVSRQAGFQGGVLAKAAKWAFCLLGIIALMGSFVLGLTAVLWRAFSMPPDQGSLLLSVVAFGLLVVFVLFVFWSSKRIARNLPNGFGGVCLEGIKDRFLGIAIVMTGIDLLVLGSVLCAEVLGNASLFVSALLVSLLLSGLFCVCFIMGGGLGATRDAIRSLFSDTQVQALKKKRATTAVGSLVAMLAMLAFFAFVGWTGMTAPYEIRPTDSENQQAYRVVAEYSGGNCVAVPLNEKEGGWVEEEGSFVALNYFDGYRTIEVAD